MDATRIAQPMLQRAGAAPAPRPLALLSVRALRSVLVLSGLFALVFSAWVLVGLDGFAYYATPLGVRGYHRAHRTLGSAGTAGEAFGVAGVLFILVPIVYLMRKRIPWLRRAGSMKTWLQIHIFCGIAGPVVVTYHTAFKFNGLVSVAYWSMIAVAVSGFVGRYLYVRIPRTIRGVEVGESELQARMADLKDRLTWITPPDVMDDVDTFEREVVKPARAERGALNLLLAGPRLRRRVRAFGDGLRRRAPGLDSTAIDELLGLLQERASLNRRLASLNQTKRLFALWHVFHLPLVYVMLAIVGLHVALVLYLGYVPFRW